MSSPRRRSKSPALVQRELAIESSLDFEDFTYQILFRALHSFLNDTTTRETTRIARDRISNDERNQKKLYISDYISQLF